MAREGKTATLERNEKTHGSIKLFTVAVPVYRELYNGNLKRLLGQIARQTISSRRIQMIAVVNNSINESLSDPWVIQSQSLRFLNDWFLRARSSPDEY